MRLLVHIAGEADLLLNSIDGCEATRAGRVAARRKKLDAAPADPAGAGAGAARRMLACGAWQDEPFSTRAPSPVLGALAALGTTRDLEVLVLGTDQDPPRSLDTLPIAQTLADVLNGIAAHDDSYPVRRATAAPVGGMDEDCAVTALTSHLRAQPYQQALVTWGSGPTSLAMGALTALSRAGLPWRLVRPVHPDRHEPGHPDRYEIVNPLEQLDIDPVVATLVRWRMFAALDELAGEDLTAVQLTDAQRRLVHQAAQRHRAGFEARDCASLRAVLADAVVRRDGSASLTVRRYITSRYEELLAIDQVDHPWAEDLLRKYEEPRGGPPIGEKLRRIGRAGHDPTVRASIGLPSYKWLYGPEVRSLQNIGRGSHRLCPPAPSDAKVIGDYLSGYDTDGSGWQEAGLPVPPVTPADTVLAVWPAGLHRRSQTGTIGEQLSIRLPAAVANHLGVPETRIRAVIFALDDGQGSRDHADADARLLCCLTNASTGKPRGEAWVEPAGTDEAAVERAVESRLTRETGALLLVPTGGKAVILPLLRAMRRVGARHGLPLFVRQNAHPATPGAYTDVYLWPALTGGDLPLLRAARDALRTLELDVAWRLLAASAVDPEVTAEAEWLATTFASREPQRDIAPAPASNPARMTGLIAERLEMVAAALAHATTSADRIRLLVLAADALEASIAATQADGHPGAEYRRLRDRLRQDARRHGTPEAASARVLLLLNEARDQAPITHGTGAVTDPDAVVTDAAGRLATEWRQTSTDVVMLPRDVSSLLRRAVAAAAARGFGQPDRPDSLLRLHEKIIEDIDGAIDERGSRAEHSTSELPVH